MYHQLLFGATCAGILLTAGLLPVPERANLADLSISEFDLSELTLPEASDVIAGIGEIVSDLPEMGASIQETVIAPSVERLTAALDAGETKIAAPAPKEPLTANMSPDVIAAAPPIEIETVTFDLDTYDLDLAAKAQLDNVVRQVAERPAAQLGIYGHTDLTGEEAYNDLLGQSRAEQVATYLTDQGVERERIKIIASYGERSPTVPTDAPSRINRRVIIEFL